MQFNLSVLCTDPQIAMSEQNGVTNADAQHEATAGAPTVEKGKGKAVEPAQDVSMDEDEDEESEDESGAEEEVCISTIPPGVTQTNNACR